MASIEVNSIISNKNTIIVVKNVMIIALSLIFLSFEKPNILFEQMPKQPKEILPRFLKNVLRD